MLLEIDDEKDAPAVQLLVHLSLNHPSTSPHKKRAALFKAATLSFENF
jgi:hypothetical protein